MALFFAPVVKSLTFGVGFVFKYAAFERFDDFEVVHGLGVGAIHHFAAFVIRVRSHFAFFVGNVRQFGASRLEKRKLSFEFGNNRKNLENKFTIMIFLAAVVRQGKDLFLSHIFKEQLRK